MRNRIAVTLLIVFVVAACAAGLVSCRETPTATERVASKGGATIATGQSYVHVWLLDAWTPITDYVRLTIGYDAQNQIGIVGHRLDGTTQYHRWNTVGTLVGYHDVPGPGEYLGEMYLRYLYTNGVSDVNYTWGMRTQQSILGFYSNGLAAHHAMSIFEEITAFPEDEPSKPPKKDDPPYEETPP